VRLGLLTLGSLVLAGCSGPFGCSDDATLVEWRQPGLFDGLSMAGSASFQRDDVVPLGWNRSDLDQAFPGEYGLHSITATRDNYTFTITSSGGWILVADPPADPHALSAEIMAIIPTVIQPEDLPFLVDSLVWSLSPPSRLDPLPHGDPVPPGRLVGGVNAAAPYKVSWIRAGPIDWEAGGFGFGKADGEGLWDKITIELDVLFHNSEGAHIEVDAYDRASATITERGLGSSWEERLGGLLEAAGARFHGDGAQTQPTTDPDACD
jgi:hypothetical protein